ncbi:uncharacterized protein LOC142387450 [Odontesthes bonariensis]|uniref:uncharacterized protein LOC142387450 n=1 Tax=Odontesthes bonariensis TaxID=219752 RepID=UPI003F581211
MEDFYINNTSTDTSYNYSSIDTNDSLDYYTDSDSYDDVSLIYKVMEWIIICAGLPLTLVAIVAVYSLVKNDHIAPVYIINLLISDLIQLCCIPGWKFLRNYIIYCTCLFGVLASVGFMVCISLERYLVITQPLWYRFRRNIKTCLIVCVVVWILPLVYVLPLFFGVNFYITETIYVVFVLLPLPLFIFFLVGTLKALSAARSVPADEKRRIVAILIVVLLIYTLLFLPSVIWSLVEKARNNRIFHGMASLFLNISPLADLTMYVFIRKGAIDKLLASMCVKMFNKQEMNSMIKPTGTMEVPEVDDSRMDEIPQEVPNLAEVEETTSMSVWTKRQLTAERKFKAAVPELLSCMLAAESVPQHRCQQCKTVDAVVRCLDCVPSGVQFLCAACDSMVHKKLIFHDREVMIDGFYKHIPPTSSVKMDERGNYELVEQGPYNLCLPAVSCPHCSSKWTPGISNLMNCKYWPATANCRMLFKFDVLTSFEQMKLASPALSQQAFIRMLEHRALHTGRMGSICGDTFHRVYREFAFCNLKKEHLCLVEPFKCPACTPDMLAISADGNRKHYRFKKSKGSAD